MNHEEALIRAFISPSRRSRYLSLLENSKGRAKIAAALDHFADLDTRYTVTIPPSQQTVDGIERMLRLKGAPATCHVMSSDQDIDNKDINLREALEETVGRGAGTLISCIPGRLAFFEGEEPNDRYILER